MKTRQIEIPRHFLFTTLASIFALAFIVSPYWLMTESASLKVVLLGITIGVGGVWAYLTASDLRVKIYPKAWISLPLLLLFGLALNYDALTSVLPATGDESYHVLMTLSLVTKIPPFSFIPAVIFGMLFLFLAWKKPGKAWLLGGLLLAGVVLFYLLWPPMQEILEYSLLRYPFVNYWFFTIVPVAASAVTSPYHEAFFRIIPFIAVVLLAWISQRRIWSSLSLAGVLWGAALLTTPLVLYYSSILYLELPAVVLMTVAAFNIDRLLSDEPEAIRQHPAWYALVLIGFVKETAIVFLLVFLLFRSVLSGRRVWHASSGKLRGEEGMVFLVQELKIGFSVLAPITLYVLLRVVLSSTRGFAPQPANLLDFSVYPLLGQALGEQFALLLPLFLGGMVVLFVKKSWIRGAFLGGVFVSVLGFHLLDSHTFVGYSRFNLFLLPSVVVASAELVAWLNGRSPAVTSGLAGLLIISGLWLSPLNPDGTKKPYWGTYRVDTAEHYYPYRRTIAWLKENHPNDRVLFTGMAYPYLFEFYFHQMQWYPEYEERLMRDPRGMDVVALVEAAFAEGFDVVVYQSAAEDLPAADGGALDVEQVIRNDAHGLVVYAGGEK